MMAETGHPDRGLVPQDLAAPSPQGDKRPFVVFRVSVVVNKTKGMARPVGPRSSVDCLTAFDAICQGSGCGASPYQGEAR